MAPPLFVLGVRRSGTTLLRVMLDRHPDLAVPDESYFIPQLAHRHRANIDPDEFVDDLRRLPTLREWQLPAEEVRARLRLGMRPGEAISAVYEAYAARQGKVRWGDKTPMYMQHLRLLERLFPDALFVHLVRDGRDASVSFRAVSEGIMTKTWAHPTDAAGFACQWRTEVAAARRLASRAGRERYLEVGYERLVVEPEAELRYICEFARLDFDPSLIDYAGDVDVSAKPHQQSLTKPPTPGLRDWRSEMPSADAVAFEGVAGDLLRELGYESGRSRPSLNGRLRLLSYSVRVAAWKVASYMLQRSPLWRRRHAPLP